MIKRLIPGNPAEPATYAEVLDFMRDNGDVPIAELYETRRQLLKDYKSSHTTLQQCRTTAHCINLIIDTRKYLDGYR